LNVKAKNRRFKQVEGQLNGLEKGLCRLRARLRH